MYGMVSGNRGCSLLSGLCSGAKFGATDESAVKGLLESALEVEVVRRVLGANGTLVF